MLVVEGFMIIDVVFAVLYTLLKSRNEILRIAVVIEVLEAVDEVGMLCEVQVLSGLTFLAHFSASTVFKGADE